MTGTKIGGQKASKTNKERHGKDFYARIGKKGGMNGRGPNYHGGFASVKVGEDGLTGRQRALLVGAKVA